MFVPDYDRTFAIPYGEGPRYSIYVSYGLNPTTFA